jgi:hypothetical protein
MKKWLVFMLFTVLMLSACQKGNDNTAYNLRDDVSNPNYMSNEVNNQPGQMSDQNPNFLNLRGTALNDASNRNNTGRDIDIAKDIVNRTGDFNADSVWINNAGDRMTVTVDTRGRNNDENITLLKARLSQALPRYTIEIRER